ncbi:hypothetical protein BST92_12030 [Nonlabens arenilitoris]|uniref:PrcB C-terminal domain-containing protein n=2 Tax=Nonlabens arenilitoris TaxID=1217969 RepID=A0A2S7UDD6_9FLAO|nr:hypothetical protein BST92_12030 [Nonlabens arenilitoris]
MDTPEKTFGLTSYYDVLLEGNNSNHESQETIVVNSEEGLQELMAQINSTRKPGLKIPSVNFKKETLIFAYGGQKSTGGFSVDVTEVRNEKNLLHFNFELIKGEGDIATMSITTPFKVIKVKHDDKKITASI